MTDKKQPRRTKWQEEVLKRYRRNLKERPEVSDEEFMAETEATDEQYAQGLGVLISAGDKPVTTERFTEDYAMDDPYSYDSLFGAWLDYKLRPDNLVESYIEVKPCYEAWLDENDLWKHLN